jgi:hypothetical protein
MQVHDAQALQTRVAARHFLLPAIFLAQLIVDGVIELPSYRAKVYARDVRFNYSAR